MNYAIRQTGRTAKTPEGYPVPTRIEATAKGPEVAYDLTITVELIDGRYEVASMTAARKPGGPEVTADGLRGIPVAKLARGIVHSSQALGLLGIRRRRFDGPTDEALQAVARVYRAAHMRREPPTAAVAKAIGRPRSTASVWIAKAREQGLLGPAEPGKAGG